MVRGASEQPSDLLRDFPRKFLPVRAYMIEDRPFAFTRHSSLRDGPFGRRRRWEAISSSFLIVQTVTPKWAGCGWS
jgi:hypothetical protein